MGGILGARTVFEFVLDSVLPHRVGDACHHCGSTSSPVFDYSGEIVNPLLAADTELALAEPEVDLLCAKCIHGGNVRRSMSPELEANLKELASDRSAARDAWDQLPEIPLFLQEFDWPFCCDAWCVFTGSPLDMETLLAWVERSVLWDKGAEVEGRDFVREGPPESLDEVSRFCCSTCEAQYHVDQFT